MFTRDPDYPNTLVRHSEDPAPDPSAEEHYSNAINQWLEWCMRNPFFYESIRWGRILGFFSVLFAAFAAHGTWKPEYAQNPPLVLQWYENAKTMPEARHHLPYKAVFCCKSAERFQTKFEVNKVNGADEWWYYTQVACVSKGCPIKRIPDDIIHPDPIPHSDDPAAEAMFTQMRTEGVLFIFQGIEMCFWPPEGGI